jgi:hypothetical protein
MSDDVLCQAENCRCLNKFKKYFILYDGVLRKIYLRVVWVTHTAKQTAVLRIEHAAIVTQ